MAHVEAGPRVAWRASRLSAFSRRALLYLGVVALLVPFVSVFVWMASASFKSPTEIFTLPPRWIFQPTLRNYQIVLEQQDFLRYFFNSGVVAAGSTAVGMVLGLPAAYAIARYRQTGVGLAILAARIMPGVAFLVPLFLLYRELGLLGTRTGLVLSHVVVTVPLTVWVLTGFFEDLPQELIDASQVDGSTRIGAFLRVAVPLVRPGMIATAVLAFTYSWNDLKFALVLASADTRTLPLAILGFVGETQIDWGAIMASATLVTLPILILTMIVQRHIVAGLTVGGVRG